MQFEFTKEYLNQLKTAIKEKNASFVSEQADELHPADIAEILDELNTDECKYLFENLEEEKEADVLVEMEDDVREKFLSELSPKEIVDLIINKINSDDAADVIGELSEKVKAKVLALIKDPDQASNIEDLLTYDEDTAGGIMAKELIAVDQDWTITQCLREMRKQAEKIHDVYAVYVVDNQGALLGLLSLNKMLVAPTHARIADIYDKEATSVKTDTSKEEVANIMEKYDLVVLPVVDNQGKLAGRITIDDVVDVIKEEADKDYQMASGISENVESSDKVWILSRARLPWLLIGMLGGILSSKVIGYYEDEIKIYPEMAFFIPLITAMGGNVGVQSSAIVVKGLANNTLGMESLLAKLLKEFGVALINGICCSAIILSYNYFFSDSMALSLTVSAALLSVIVFAGILGTLVPLILNNYKVDAALATGPFITTTNDILGLVVYFIIGRLMYQVF